MEIDYLKKLAIEDMITISQVKEINLVGKIALVTGSTSGIGEKIIRSLAFHGAETIIHGRNKDNLKKILEDLQKENLKASGCVADLLVKDKIKKMFYDIRKRYDHLDILINNAAVYGKNIANMDSKEVETIIKTNIVAPIHCVRYALPLMGENARIINIGSVEALCGCFAKPVYVASKAGLLGFTIALSKKLAAKKINVNIVSPGPTSTERIKRTFIKDYFLTEELENSGFFTDIQDIINAILFLSSPLADSITGQNFVISTKNKKHFYD